MYENFFGLHRRPFASAPDPRCFVPVQTMQAALDTLAVSVEWDQGIALVTAAAGLGKSLLCRKLAEELKSRWRAVVIENGNFPTRVALLQTILFELQRPYRQMTEHELRLDVLTAARQLHADGHRLLLIIDEAETLDDEVLDEIRSLTNLVENGQPVVRVVLCGQVDLEERLAAPEYKVFNQRVSRHVTLDPLTQQESADYIRWRLEWAGGRLEEVFTSEAVRAICYASDGVPRCLNYLCDHSLLLGFVAEERPVDAETVEEALEDLKHLPLTWKDPPWLKPSLDHVAERASLSKDNLRSSSKTGQVETTNTAQEELSDNTSQAAANRHADDTGQSAGRAENDTAEQATSPEVPQDMPVLPAEEVSTDQASPPACAASAEMHIRKDASQEAEHVQMDPRNLLPQTEPSYAGPGDAGQHETAAVVEIGFETQHDFGSGHSGSRQPASDGPARGQPSGEQADGGATLQQAATAGVEVGSSTDSATAAVVEVGYGINWRPEKPFEVSTDDAKESSAATCTTHGAVSAVSGSLDSQSRTAEGRVRSEPPVHKSFPDGQRIGDADEAPQPKAPAEADSEQTVDFSDSSSGITQSASEPDLKVEVQDVPTSARRKAETAGEMGRVFEEIPVVDRYAALDAVAEGADPSGIVWEIGPDDASRLKSVSQASCDAAALESDVASAPVGDQVAGVSHVEVADGQSRQDSSHPRPSAGSRQSGGEAQQGTGYPHASAGGERDVPPAAHVHLETTSSTHASPPEQDAVRGGGPRPDLAIDELMPLLQEESAETGDSASERAAAELASTDAETLSSTQSAAEPQDHRPLELEPERSIGESVLNMCIETRSLLLAGRAERPPEAGGEFQAFDRTDEADRQPTAGGEAGDQGEMPDEAKEAEPTSAPSVNSSSSSSSTGSSEMAEQRESEAVGEPLAPPSGSQSEAAAAESVPIGGLQSGGSVDSWEHGEGTEDDDVVRLPDGWQQEVEDRRAGRTPNASSLGSKDGACERTAGRFVSGTASGSKENSRSSVPYRRRPYAFLFTELRRRQRFS